MTHTFALDPVLNEVAARLSDLDAGLPIQESQHVDLKEEHGRRDKSGAIGPGSAHNDRAAKELAAAAACMANSAGGGALICGVTDAGVPIGTELDTEWLRHRIYELTDRRLTVDIAEHHIGGVRLLVVRVPQAIEPIRHAGRLTWRVGSHCVEVDPTTWHARRMAILNYDWSGEESNVPASAARAGALEQARTFLRESDEDRAHDLAGASDGELLRRLNVVSGDGLLTNAGVLAFVGRGSPCIDYVRRDVAGGDSTWRMRRPGRSLLEELADAFDAVEAGNALLHVQRGGLVVGQLRELPPLAAREAVVNGVAHREWAIAEPTAIEHVGRTLRVTSPGGFVAGVTEDNILSHPSRSRNRSLTELLAALRVAEREGLGVDRMVREMIAVGHQPPTIQEVGGPYVRASLVGDNVDLAWMAWLVDVLPQERRRDVHALLILRRLVVSGWADVASVARLIQLTAEEARGALEVMAAIAFGDGPLIVRAVGVPVGAEDVWRLSDPALAALRRLDVDQGKNRSWPTREQVAATYAAARGRISTTELGGLVGAAASNVGSVLKSLEDQGLLEASREVRRGKGFFYRYIGN